MFEPAIAKASKRQALPFSVRGKITSSDDYEEIGHPDLLREHHPENEEVIWEHPVEADEELSDIVEEKKESAGGGEFNSMKMYLKAIGRIPLLTKKEELELAVRIETGREKLTALAFSLPFALRKLISLGVRVEKGEVPLVEVVQFSGNRESVGLDEMRHFFMTTKIIKSLHRRRRLTKIAKSRKPRCGFSVSNGGQDLAIPCRETYGSTHKRIIEKIMGLRLNNDFVHSFYDELAKTVGEIESIMSEYHTGHKSKRVPVAARRIINDHEKEIGIPTVR